MSTSLQLSTTLTTLANISGAAGIALLAASLFRRTAAPAAARKFVLGAHAALIVFFGLLGASYWTAGQSRAGAALFAVAATIAVLAVVRYRRPA